eukprot:COSAG01_NODE_8519_length_2755_cov_8.227410_5_plen_73_part_00
MTRMVPSRYLSIRDSDTLSLATRHSRDAYLDAYGYRTVSRAFPSWNRSILTEIYLCHPCSCEIEDGNARAGS